MKRLYLLPTAAGLVLPCSFFTLFLLHYSIDLPLLIDQLFANDISTFFSVDLLVTTVVVLLFPFRESQRNQPKNWWAYAVATVVVGPSFARPLFPYFQQSWLENLASEA